MENFVWCIYAKHCNKMNKHTPWEIRNRIKKEVIQSLGIGNFASRGRGKIKRDCLKNDRNKVYNKDGKGKEGRVKVHRKKFV